MNPISDEIKEQILDLYFNKGFKMTEIEEKLNVSRPVISNIINEYKQKQNIDIKLSKVNTVKLNKDTKESYRHMVNIPPDFLKAIDIKNDERDIKILVDKKEKEIKIKKIDKKD